MLLESGVPPHLLADASGSTSWGSGLHEQNVLDVLSATLRHSTRSWTDTDSQVSRIAVACRSSIFNHFTEEQLNQSTDSAKVLWQESIQSMKSENNLVFLRYQTEKGQQHYVPLNLAPVNEERDR